MEHAIELLQHELESASQGATSSPRVPRQSRLEGADYFGTCQLRHPASGTRGHLECPRNVSRAADENKKEHTGSMVQRYRRGSLKKDRSLRKKCEA